MEKLDKSIGIKIRKVRELKNFSQNYVASKLSMNQSTYSDIENGVISISEEKLMRIADALEVSREVIEWFNDQVIFNSCVQSGYVNTNHINPIEKIQQIHDELVLQFKSEIEILKETLKAKDDLIEMLKTKQ